MSLLLSLLLAPVVMSEKPLHEVERCILFMDPRLYLTAYRPPEAANHSVIYWSGGAVAELTKKDGKTAVLLRSKSKRVASMIKACV